MTFSSILIEVDGPVGILTLNKPDRHNAFDETLMAEITAGLKQLEADPAVRVVVLSATGKSFCAGADLNWMKRAAGYTPEQNLADAGNLAELLRTLNTLAKPTVARVQGPAYGGGVGLVAACDVAVASYDAMFALTEVKLGLIPAVISPYVIAALASASAAATSSPPSVFPPPKATAWGCCTRSCRARSSWTRPWARSWTSC